MMDRSAAVENYFPPNDFHIWYPIKGFPSYEISTPDYLLRSYKHIKYFPYGRLIKIEGGFCTITDCNNFSRKVHMDTLIKLLDYEDPRRTFDIHRGVCRNQRLFIDESELDKIGEAIKRPARIYKKKGLTSMVHFKTI